MRTSRSAGKFVRSLSIGLWVAGALCAQSVSSLPEYSQTGELVRPANYREWVYLSSGLGMTYGPAAATSSQPLFDNVFVRPESYRAFLETGKWPDKTMFVLEVRRSSGQGSINKGGNFQADLAAIEVEVKDESRFPEKWAFFDFGTTRPAAKKLDQNRCFGCHSANGAVDNTFVQFYPTLIDVAKAKGTFKSADQTAPASDHAQAARAR